MPISIDRFEGATPPRDPTTSERILRFLSVHDRQAYTRREIAAAIDTDPETVGTNLTRLKERGLVRHREPYWAFTDDRDHARSMLRDRYDDDALAHLLGERHRPEPNEEAGPSEAAAEEDATRSSSVQTSARPHREVATAFFERVRDRLDGEIDALYLFGSVARDVETAASDVDILAVIADDADYATVDDRLLDIAYDIQIEYGAPIEVHAMEASEFAARKARGEPLVRTVIEEGERLG